MNDQKRKEAIDEVLMLIPLTFKKLLTPNELPVQMPKSQKKVLLILLTKDVLNMTDLSKLAEISVQQATKTVNALENDGYIERFINKENRRQVCVQLTKQGREFLESSRKKLNNMLLDHFKDLSDEEMRELQSACVIVKTLLQKLENRSTSA